MKNKVLVLIIVGLLVAVGLIVLSKDAIIKQFARAISRAEGFQIPDSRPARNHNPGDLTVDTTGKGIERVPQGFVQYATDADGWQALERQVSLMFNGSQIYNSTMTIADVAFRYTTTDQAAWAMIVAQTLGVTISTRLDELGGKLS